MNAYYENLYYEKKDSDIHIRYNPKHVGCTAHLHHHIEIVVVLSGKVQASIDRREYVLQAGDVVAAFPNQVHMYTDLPECENILMIFPPDYCQELEKIFTRKTPVSSAVYQVGEETLRFAAEAQRAASAGSSPYARAAVRGYVMLFLSRLLCRMTLENADKADYQTLKTLKSILYFCDDHYMDERLTLESIARGLNISKYYISHMFNDKLKISFSDYVSSLRVRQACLRLRGGKESISQVALSCGFNSIRSFNRHFVELTGQTPTAYRSGAAETGMLVSIPTQPAENRKEE